MTYQTDDTKKIIEANADDLERISQMRQSSDPTEILMGTLEYWNKYGGDLNLLVINWKERKVIREIIEFALKSQSNG